MFLVRSTLLPYCDFSRESFSSLPPLSVLTSIYVLIRDLLRIVGEVSGDINFVDYYGLTKQIYSISFGVFISCYLLTLGNLLIRYVSSSKNYFINGCYSNN